MTKLKLVQGGIMDDNKNIITETVTDVLDEKINIENVKKILYFNEHPNPLLVLSIIIINIIIIYYLYIIFIKTCFSGIWYNENGNEFIIDHNKWRDTITINFFQKGEVYGNALNIYDKNNKIKLGILYNNKIYWVGSDSVWRKPKYLY
jgi:hypothetical protein